MVKMAVCPRCKKVIEELILIRSGWEECDFFWNEEKGYIDWKNEEFKGDGDVLEYNCPKCSNTLFTDELEAENFIKYRDELKELIVEKLKKNDY